MTKWTLNFSFLFLSIVSQNWLFGFYDNKYGKKKLYFDPIQINQTKPIQQ